MTSKKPAHTTKKAAPAGSRAGEPAEGTGAAKIKQTIYLHPETRKKLRLQAVEEDSDLSTVVERALQAYFDR